MKPGDEEGKELMESFLEHEEDREDWEAGEALGRAEDGGDAALRSKKPKKKRKRRRSSAVVVVSPHPHGQQISIGTVLSLLSFIFLFHCFLISSGVSTSFQSSSTTPRAHGGGHEHQQTGYSLFWRSRGGGSAEGMDASEVLRMREEVREMFYHGWDNYLRHAHPLDELKPLSCSGHDTLGGYHVTLVDTLDTLLVFGNRSEFIRAVEMVKDLFKSQSSSDSFYSSDDDSDMSDLATEAEPMVVVQEEEDGSTFTSHSSNTNSTTRRKLDKDTNVSVFETNIRLLGGLLSAHLLASSPLSIISSSLSSTVESSSDPNQMLVPTYDGFLLDLAKDLGDRLLPAFSTPTGLPYGTVNLRHGVPNGETTITSTAGAGTFAIEFGVLSRLTEDWRYEHAAKKASRSLFNTRSTLGLLGNHINVSDGSWTLTDTNIGPNVDSYFEYMFKAAVLFNDREYQQMFDLLYEAAMKHMHKPPWYVGVNMNSGVTTYPHFNSLQAFWPGLQAQKGDIQMAADTMKAFHSIWRRFGFVPETLNLITAQPVGGQAGYPLRPEMAESLYFLWMATGDPVWRRYGRDMIYSLQKKARGPCGFAAVENVETHELRDHMDSFFLSETCKYLFLLFDDNNFVHNSSENQGFVFNTEAHLFPLLHIFSEGYNSSNDRSYLELQSQEDREKYLNQHMMPTELGITGTCLVQSYIQSIAADGFGVFNGVPKQQIQPDSQVGVSEILETIPDVKDQQDRISHILQWKLRNKKDHQKQGGIELTNEEFGLLDEVGPQKASEVEGTQGSLNEATKLAGEAPAASPSGVNVD